MRKAPLAIWLLVAVVSAALIGVVVLGAVSVIRPGGMQVTMPGEQQVSVTFEGGLVLVTTIVDVENNGAYDLEDAVIDIVVTGPDGLLMERTLSVGDIRAGGTTPVAVGASLDLNGLSNELKNRIVFEGVTLNVTATVRTNYMMGMVSGNFVMERTVAFSPLITNLSVDTQNVQLNTTTSAYIIEVPFSFEAAPSIVGSIVIANATLSNATGLIGLGSSDFTVAQRTTGVFPVVMSDAGISFLLSQADELRMDLALSVGNVSLTQVHTESWQPLLAGLQMDGSNLTMVRNGSQSHLLLPYQMDTSPRLTGLTFVVDATVRNESGLVGAVVVPLTMAPHLQGTLDVIVDGSVVDWFAQHAEQLSLTLRVSRGAASFEQVVPLSWDPDQGLVLG